MQLSWDVKKYNLSSTEVCPASLSAEFLPVPPKESELCLKITMATDQPSRIPKPRLLP